MSKSSDERLRSYLDHLNLDLMGIQHDSIFIQEAIHRFRSRASKRCAISNEAANEYAISTFIACNESMSGFSHSIHPDVVSYASDFIFRALGKFTRRYDSTPQCVLSLSLLMSFWRFGPGASNAISGTHFVDKILQPMTCTPSAEPYVRLLRKLNPYLNSYDAVNGGGTAITYGSRLTTVPKDQKTARTIAIEPSGNMALQLAGGAYLEGVLRSIGLDITNQQDKNKLLAQRASIDRSLATVDLSSASDLITPSLVKALLPSDWYHFLMAIRSPVIEVNQNGEKSLHDLNMISTMGCGFTFPLMTLILLSLVYATMALKGCGKIDYSDVAVFGDDIILPIEHYQDLCNVLSSAGLRVNYDKSCTIGFFRESCGGDFFNGYNVTPVYIKSLSTPPDVYVAINQLLKWSVEHDVCVYRTLRFLFSLLPHKPFLVPIWSQDFQGIKTSECPRRYKNYQVVNNARFKRFEPLSMLAILGGYCTGSRDGISYNPRMKQVNYKVCTSVLPRGSSDGSDLTLLEREKTVKISAILDLI